LAAGSDLETNADGRVDRAFSDRGFAQFAILGVSPGAFLIVKSLPAGRE
jgi:hypothetical protein